MTKSKKTKQLEVHIFSHQKYERILKKIRNDYLENNEPDYLSVPYVLMCSLTLEAKLNDELHNHASKVWREGFGAIASSYMSMNFRGKLNSLVPILTDNKYRINQEHFVYQRLASLISTRNALVHPKITIRNYTTEEPAKKVFPYSVNLPPEYYEEVDDLTLGSGNAFTPMEYHEALEKLDKWFFLRCPDQLSKLEMVIANENS